MSPRRSRRPNRPTADRRRPRSGMSRTIPSAGSDQAADFDTPSRRAQKVAEAVREVVSLAILTELKDPRVRDVTVTYVEVSADLRYAKVHVSVMGDAGRQQLCLRGLASAAGYLQARLARELELRYTPKLTFILDQGVKHSIEIARLLKEVLPAADTPGSALPAAAASGPEPPDPQADQPPRADRGQHEP